jgi:hypothetical protein
MSFPLDLAVDVIGGGVAWSAVYFETRRDDLADHETFTDAMFQMHLSMTSLHEVGHQWRGPRAGPSVVPSGLRGRWPMTGASTGPARQPAREVPGVYVSDIGHGWA